MSDARVPMALAMEAFGVPIEIVRPSPDDEHIQTTGVWLLPAEDAQPFGTDYKRREPPRVMAITRTETLTHLPQGTTILAAEESGADERTWQVVGYAADMVVDEMRVILKPMSDGL